MVHIKKVEIFGFKSFGFRNTVVDFRPGLVSISGPNGSGKSNILDAIIFASGEMRPKVMRVDKIRSLIHDVSSSGGGSRMARVSVHFENSDRKIPFDSDSVEITRELSPDGENVYYINKKKTQRMHVVDLLEMANAGSFYQNSQNEHSHGPYAICHQTRVTMTETSCMRDLILSTLITFGRISPLAKMIASSMLLLPDPFGPDMETSPGRKSTTVLRKPNDLKPNISTFLICTMSCMRLHRVIDCV